MASVKEVKANSEVHTMADRIDLLETKVRNLQQQLAETDKPYVDPRTKWAKHKGGNGPSTATSDHDSRPSEGVSAEEMPADDTLQ